MSKTKTAKKTTSKKAAPIKAASKGAKKMGALDAATDVLGKAKQPMACPDIVAKMLAGGLWITGGKTPAATLNAAIIREIAAKGKASRFKKTGRGMFALNGSSK